MKRFFRNIFSSLGRISRQGPAGMGLLLLIVLAVPAVYLQSDASRENSTSVEVGFSSLSPNGPLGGEIVPASCESGGYDHTNGVQIVNIRHKNAPTPEIPVVPGGAYRAADFGNYCFGNNGARPYLPALGTWAEFLRFWNTIPSLSGLYQIP